MLSGKMEGYGNFIYETFSRIAKQHPEHEFIYIFDQSYYAPFITSKNIKAIVAGPAAKYPLLWKYWYDVKIPSVLKKIKADVFVSCDGLCSLKTTIPQCLIIHDLSFSEQPLLIKKSHAVYLEKQTPKYLSKAKTVVTTSDFLKNELINHYQIDALKITTTYYGARETFQPLVSDEKTVIKNMFTDGKEYLVYAGLIDKSKNLLNLLKAFSVFKKRQQTSMKLVLVGNVDSRYESFKKDLQSYKFRADVVLVDFPDETSLINLTGAAYGFIHPSLIEEFPVAVMEAMKMEVPVIAVATTTLKEIGKAAVLFSDDESHIAMADKMMLLYKDEKLRNGLIINGRKVATEYSWDKTAELLWQTIQKTVG